MLEEGVNDGLNSTRSDIREKIYEGEEGGERSRNGTDMVRLLSPAGSSIARIMV